MIARAAPMSHVNWITSRAGCDASDAFRAIEVIDDFGDIKGMIGFDNWTENSVFLNIAIQSPIALRRLVKAAAEYVFNQTKKRVAICLVRGSNYSSIDLCMKLGFREAYHIKDGVKDGEDLIIFEMRKNECRFLNGRNGHG